MRFSLLLSLLLLLPYPGHCSVQPFGKLQEEQRFKDYTIKIYRNEEAPAETDTNPDHQDGVGCFEILKSGKQVYFQKGFMFEVAGQQSNGQTNSLIAMGRSITSDKQPNLVVREWSGGAHCCYTFTILQISDVFRVVDQIDTRNDDYPEFKDLRKDGSLDLVMDDWTFEYWHVCFADSPSPTVILLYQNHKYRPDLELMKKPAPSDQELHIMAKSMSAKFDSATKFNDDEKWAAPVELWGKMLDLIYSGNMDSAWKLCDLSWPAKHPGKELFLKEFADKLMTSPYYNDINQVGFQAKAKH